MTIYSLNVTHPTTDKTYVHMDMKYWLGADDGLIYFNTSIEIFEELLRSKAIVKLFVPNSEDDKIYNHLFFQSTADLCKLIGGSKSNLFMRLFMEGFMKASDQHIDSKCL